MLSNPHSSVIRLTFVFPRYLSLSAFSGEDKLGVVSKRWQLVITFFLMGWGRFRIDWKGGCEGGGVGLESRLRRMLGLGWVCVRLEAP